MRRSITVLAMLAMLIGLSIPVSAHTTHAHICGSTHTWLSDGNGWRHDAFDIYIGGNVRNRVRHQLNASGVWVNMHTTYSGICP